MEIIWKTLLWHIVISIISIFILGNLINLFDWIDNPPIFYITFISVLGLYCLSGYIISTKRFAWYWYTSIAVIGIALSLNAYIISPESLDWKSTKEAGNWLYYRIFITGIEFPMNFVKEINSLPVKTQVYFLAIFPVLASAMQYLGAFLKDRMAGRE